MFGSSVGCLGDTDADKRKEVIVGAPYFGDNGAVFVYKATHSTGDWRLELRQTILSPSGEKVSPVSPSRGFGLRVESPVVLRGELLLPSTVVDQRVEAVNIPTRSKGKACGTTTGHSPGVSS